MPPPSIVCALVGSCLTGGVPRTYGLQTPSMWGTGLAQTISGMEFYLGRITLADPTDLDGAISLFTEAIRSGDSIFAEGNDIYVAFVGTPLQAGKGVRRLMGIAKEVGLDLKIRLVAEPLPPEMREAAAKIIV